jgi:hypothetical protein
VINLALVLLYSCIAAQQRQHQTPTKSTKQLVRFLRVIDQRLIYKLLSKRKEHNLSATIYNSVILNSALHLSPKQVKVKDKVKPNNQIQKQGHKHQIENRK